MLAKAPTGTVADNHIVKGTLCVLLPHQCNGKSGHCILKAMLRLVEPSDGRALVQLARTFHAFFFCQQDQSLY